MADTFNPKTDIENEAVNWALNQKWEIPINSEEILCYFEDILMGMSLGSILVTNAQYHKILYYEEQILA
jgi:hypothetical protein